MIALHVIPGQSHVLLLKTCSRLIQIEIAIEIEIEIE
jgi:hypothetical protein